MVPDGIQTEGAASASTEEGSKDASAEDPAVAQTVSPNSNKVPPSVHCSTTAPKDVSAEGFAAAQKDASSTPAAVPKDVLAEGSAVPNELAPIATECASSAMPHSEDMKWPILHHPLPRAQLKIQKLVSLFHGNHSSLL